jgi:hypothetical protein
MFDDSPTGFFGPTYSLTGNAVTLPTVSSTDVTVGTFTCDGTTSTVTVSAAHNLKVGDKVAISSSTTLPAPFTAADHYVVSVPLSTTLTLALAANGTAIVSTNTGTGTHTIKALGVLQEVTDAEAHATTGDWRKVAFGICEAMYQKQINTPTADRPTKVSFTRSSSTNETTGVVTKFYGFSFSTAPLGFEVADE